MLVAFPIGFGAIWSAVCFLLGTVGGWRALGRSYRVAEEPPGAEGTSGRMRGVVGYNYVMHVGGTPEGLYLGVNVLFRPGHPHVVVPWDRVDELGEAFSFWGSWVKLGLPGTSLAIPREVWERARQRRPA